MILEQNGTLFQIPSTCIIVKNQRNCNRNVEINKKIKNIELKWVNMTATLLVAQRDIHCLFSGVKKQEIDMQRREKVVKYRGKNKRKGYEEEKTMGFADPVNYTVVTIDGDYAMLRNESEPDAELAQVALALLPEGITDGSRVQRVMLEYTLL